MKVVQRTQRRDRAAGPRAKLATTALASALLAACGGASAEGGGPCTGTGACAPGVCVAGRCRPADSAPAKPAASRVVLFPRDLAVLVSGDEDADAMPETVALGRKSAGRAMILMRFVATWREDSDIQSAYFILDVEAGAPLPESPPTAEVARILSPWSSATTSWGRQPRLGMPESVGPLRVLPSLPIRLDVTPQVRAWAEHDRDDHGLALVVDGSDPNGVLASTGLTKGLGPHLEVYLR